MRKIDGELCRALDTILEADFLGRDQTLTLEQAQQRLKAAVDRRAAGRRGELSTAINDIERQAEHGLWFTELSYRSVAYDAAGLTATLTRVYANSAYKIIDAHMKLMRSMIMNAEEPDIQPLWDVTAELTAG